MSEPDNNNNKNNRPRHWGWKLRKKEAAADTGEKKVITLNSILSNNKLLRIISLVLAIVIWAGVSTGAAVEDTRVIKNVPIEFDPNGSLYQAFSLRIVESSVDSVDVTVVGPRYVISGLTASDIRVTANIGDVNAAGDYTLTLKAGFQESGKDAVVSLSSTDSVTAQFDTYETVVLTIEAEAESSLSIADNHVLGIATVSPASVSVHGPKTLVSRIARAVAYYAGSSQKLSNSFITESDITLLDSDGVAIVSKNITMTPTVTEVSVPILKRKKVDVAVTLLNAPDGYAEQFVSISPAQIEIAGPAEVVDAMSALTVGTINVSEITASDSYRFTIAMTQNMRDVNNVGFITVDINYKNVKSKTFTINSFTFGSGFSAITDYSLTVVNQTLENVTVMGKSSVISNLSASDLTAVISIDPNTLSAGQVELPVTITASDGSLVWAVGSYTVLVNVTAK